MNQEVFSQILLINKPLEWTSFDVVKKIRFAIKKKYNLNKIKVGHCGTLDPLATGLLIIATGSKTKSIKNFENLRKTYAGTLKVGCITDSFDSEKPEKKHCSFEHINFKKINNVFSDFIGAQSQMPPIFSAIKVEGERLYKKARRGEHINNLKSRSINIYELSVENVQLPYIEFVVTCSKGTYIRSLAHDIGQKLGCGAYLSSLNRLEIGNYKLKDAHQIIDLPSFI